MNTPAGIALAGAGFISYLHLLACRACPDIKVVAMASRTPDVARHRAGVFNVAAYTFDELAAMCARPDVDVVFILGPNALRVEQCRSAIEAGKHLVIEKPMAVTLKDADAIIAAADRRGVGIAYAENHAFSSLLIKARELVAAGEIGTVQGVKAFMGHGGPAKGWWYDPALSGGGALIDLVPHVLSGALFLLGKPQVSRVAEARLKQSPDRGAVDTHAEVKLETAQDVAIDLTGSWETPNDTTFYELTGTRGVLKVVLEPDPKWITFTPQGGEARDIEFPGRLDFNLKPYIATMGYTLQLEHFLACFREGTTPRESGRDGREVLNILLAAAVSAQRQQPVALQDAIPADRTPHQLWVSD